VRVDLARVLSIGQEVEGSDSGGERVIAEFGLANLEGPLLVIRFPVGHQAAPGVVTGALKPLPPDTRAAVLSANVPVARLLPLLLDATDTPTGDWLWLLAGVMLAGWSVWRVKLALERRADPLRHPTARRLSAHGNPAALADDLDTGLRKAGSGLQVLGATLAPGFLVHRTWFDTMVLPDQGILWVYKKVTRKSVNFIPTGKDYHAVVRGKYGERVELKGREAAVDQALQRILEKMPWVLAGYDAGIARLMQTHQGRAELARIVAARLETCERDRVRGGAPA
jgi:hypothetical protein